jgi:hypothetical protein
MMILGVLVASLGVILILIGVIGAAKDVFAAKGKGFSAGEQKLAELFFQVVFAILKGPPWLVMVFFGACLVFFGHQLSVGGWPFTG